MADDKDRRTNDAETRLALISEKLASVELRANESMSQKEQEWEARIDEATSKALQEVSAVTACYAGAFHIFMSRVYIDRSCVNGLPVFVTKSEAFIFW